MDQVTAIVVTGGRDFIEYNFIADILWAISPKLIIIGCCPTGLDAAAFAWAGISKTPHQTIKADWIKYGKPAGPMRNKEMIQAGLKVGAILIAFPGNQGTASCKAEARNAKMPIIEVRPK